MEHIDRMTSSDPRIQAFLKELYDREQTTPKAWRQVANGGSKASETVAPLT